MHRSERGGHHEKNPGADGRRIAAERQRPGCGGVRALGSADGKGDRDRAVCQKRARKAGTGQRH